MFTNKQIIVLAAHLPPPVNGQTIAVSTFCALLEEAAQECGAVLRRLTITSDGPRGLRHHKIRLTRVARVLLEVIRSRPRALYISADAGYGMIYTFAMVVIARCMGSSVYIHHHSINYMDRRDWKFFTICAVSSPTTCHLVGCERMRAALIATYNVKRVEVLPIMYAVARSSSAAIAKRTPRESGRALRIGHLSNLTVEKGLGLVFDTAEALKAQGIPCELVIAGATVLPRDQRLLEERSAATSVPVRFLGPVYGREREEFFELIDVFIFPSRFRRESFGLVTGEALVRGCPVVSYETACLDATVVGEGGLVLSRAESFTEAGTEWLRDIYLDDAKYRNTVEGALRVATAQGEAWESARRVANALVDLPRP